MKTIIMRGAPGFGKSTYAAKILPLVLGLRPDEIAICSADNFFVNDNGDYDWRPSLIGEAHKYCRELFYKAHTFVDGSIKAVVVDNTNINKEDMAFYWGLGTLFGEVEFHQLGAPVQVAAGRNVHGVPEKTVLGMAERLKFNRVPKRWQPHVVKVQSEPGVFIVEGQRFEIPEDPEPEVVDEEVDAEAEEAETV